MFVYQEFIAFMAISYAKKVAALAGKALAIAGATPVKNAFGPFVFKMSLKTWLYDLYLLKGKVVK